MQIQDEVEKNIKNNEKPDILPHLSPEPLLTTEEIQLQTTKKTEEFIKLSLARREKELKAENEVADKKIKNLVKDIIDPMSGLFADDQIGFQQISQPNTTDNTYKLKPQVEKQLNEMVFKNVQQPPIQQPPPPLPIQNIRQNGFYIGDFYIFTVDEPDSLAVIDLKTHVVQDDQLMTEHSKDQLEISKSLRDADIEMISDPKEITYIRTVSTRPRNRLLRKVRNHPYNLKQDEVKFMRQAPVHPRDRLKKASDRLRR